MTYYPTNMMMGGAPVAPSAPSYPLGYGGYNGGYYGGGYNTYNPYFLQQQQQIAQQQAQQELKNQQDVIAKFYRSSCNTANNGDPREEVLDRIYNRQSNQEPTYIEGLTMEQNAEYRELLERDNDIRSKHATLPYMVDMQHSQQYIVRAQQLSQCNKIAEQRAQVVSNDMGLAEYFAGPAVQDVLQAEDRQMKMEQSNLGELYNSNGYNKFLNQFKHNGPFAALNPNATIDDMTINLPSMVSERTRAERRKAFLASIGVG